MRTFEVELLIAKIRVVVVQLQLETADHSFYAVMAEEIAVAGEGVVTQPDAVFVDEDRLLVMQFSLFGQHATHLDDQFVDFLFVFGEVYQLLHLLLVANSLLHFKLYNPTYLENCSCHESKISKWW